ncbi:MAG: methyltransferase domain-containing protein [Thermoplasmata archaeon]
MPAVRTEEGLVWLEAGASDAVPLRFIEEHGRYFVLATTARTKWVGVSLRTGGCFVTRSGSLRQRCAVDPVIDPFDRARIHAGFRIRYGAAAWLPPLSPSLRILRLDPGASVIERSQADRARLEFDAAAPDYADRVAARRVERYLKATTLARLRTTFSGVDPLLEIGPGVGLETIPLLADGHRITAVDLSGRMLEELRKRADRIVPGNRLDCRVGRLGDLDTALAGLPAGSFAGAFSTFGAFNLEEDLTTLRRGLANALGTEARLAFTTLNRPAPLPMLWDAVDGHLREVPRRMLLRTATENTTYPLDLFRRRPAEWDVALRPEFLRRSSEAVSVLAPPFEPVRAWAALGETGHRAIARADGWLRRRRVLAELGEWALLTYERLPPAG